MDAAGMIKRRLGSKLYTVTRAGAAGSYSPTDGTFTDGTPTTVQVQGSLQPATVNDLISLPEGDRDRESFRFFSVPPLQNNNTPNLNRGDLINVSGVTYRVASVQHWQVYGRAIIVRENTNAN